MKHNSLKITGVLIILFLLDAVNPFSYSLHTEFIFLGIVFISLNTPIFTALILSIIFGYCKDCLSLYSRPAALIEFPLVVLAVHYLLRHFQKKTAKIFIFFGVLIFHIVMHNYYAGALLPVFSLFFLINSTLLFFLLCYLLKGWIVQENNA